MQRSNDPRKMRSYRLHGLSIESAFDLGFPEAAPATAAKKETVGIELGAVPRRLQRPLGSRAGFKIAHEEAIFYVSRVARFHITGGQRVAVEPAADSDPAAVRLFILGAAIGVVLHQRGFFPLHGCALSLDGKGLAFLGPSGRGKSTLAAAFSEAEHKILSDDRFMLNLPSTGRYVVEPGLPIFRLRSLAVMKGQDLSAAYMAPDVDDKWSIPAARLFSTNAVPLTSLFFLEWSNSKTTKIIRLNRFDALAFLRRDVWLNFFINVLGRESEFFTWAADLLNHVPAFVLRRPRDLDSMGDVIARVEDHVSNF